MPKTYRVLILVLFLTLATTQLAGAHARLLRSNPEDSALLTEPPKEVFMWFDEPIAVEFSSVEILDANAQSMGLATLRGDAVDPTLMIATLPDLPAEDTLYSLNWKALSNADSHVTQGTLVFGIGQPSNTIVRPTEPERFEVPPAEVLLRGMNYLALSALIGSILINGLILRPHLFDTTLRAALASARRRVGKFGMIAALLTLLVGVGLLLWQATVVGNASLASLLSTRFGGLWIARQVAALIVLVVLFVTRGEWSTRIRTRLAIALPILALAVIQALSSHAAGLPDRTVLAIVASALHLLAAAAWVGSIFALLVGLFPLLRSRRAELIRIALQGWRRFGVMAMISVGLLAASGMYNASRQVASVDALIDSPYGQVLAGKTILFLGAGLAGLINSLLLHPKLSALLARMLHRPRGWKPLSRKRFPLVLLIEASLVGLIFAASSVITSAPPPRGPEFLPAVQIAKPPSTLALPADDMLINLTIKPNKPGLNLITIDAFNQRRPTPAETLRVQLRLTYLDQDLGTQTLITELEEGERYRLSTSALSFGGAWDVQVIVRRKGMEDTIAHFDWQVESLAPNVQPRAVLISNAPIEPVLSLLAVLFIVFTGMGGFILRRNARGARGQSVKISSGNPLLLVIRHDV